MAPPSLRTQEMADTICKHLESGLSLRKVCGLEGMPSKTFVLDWANEDEAFAAQYTRARERGWDDRAEQAVDEAKLVEDATKGRLAFDAERWYLGKMAPKRYGDRQVVAGDPEAPLVGMTEDALTARIQELLKP